MALTISVIYPDGLDGDCLVKIPPHDKTIELRIPNECIKNMFFKEVDEKEKDS